MLFSIYIDGYFMFFLVGLGLEGYVMFYLVGYD